MSTPADPTYRMTEAEQVRASQKTRGASKRRGALPFELPDRYEYVEELGRGGMGIVARVYDRELQRDVALKVIIPQRASRDALARFINEARVTAQLEHPAIMPVHDAGRIPGLQDHAPYFFTMKLVTGTDLKRRALEAQHDESFPLEEKLNIIIRAAEGLSYMHSRGFIHRDIKGENILLGDHGEVLIADLGIAKQLDRGMDVDSASIIDEEQLHAEPAVTMQGKIMGTPAYMPPEQARGLIDRLGPWTDIWALGAVLYALLAGRAPYESRKRDVMELLSKARKGRPAPIEKVADVPRPLAAIINKAMATVPNRRYQDARALARDLRAFLADEPITVYKPGGAERVVRWARRNPTKSVAAVLLSGFILLGGGVASHLSSQAAAQEREAELARARAIAAEDREAAQSAAAREAELQRRVAEQQAERERLRALAEAEKYDELREAVGLEARQQRDAATAEIWEAIRREARLRPGAVFEDLWQQIPLDRVVGYADQMAQALRTQEAVGSEKVSALDLMFVVGAYQRASRFQDAAPWMTRLLNASPHPNVSAQTIASLQGAQLRHAGDTAEAERHYRRFVREYPGDPRAWNGLTELLAAREQWDKVLEGVEKYFRTSPDAEGRALHRDVVMEVLRGRAYRMLGDRPSARRAYLAAVEMDPQAWQPYSELGVLAGNQGNWLEAKRHFERAREYCPIPAERQTIESNLRVVEENLHR